VLLAFKLDTQPLVEKLQLERKLQEVLPRGKGHTVQRR